VLSRDAFEVWIKPTTLVLLEEALAVVTTPNIFVRQELELHYKEHLESALSSVCGRRIVVEAAID
jgi:chromosomal replication initiation ATPase DnaA